MLKYKIPIFWYCRIYKNGSSLQKINYRQNRTMLFRKFSKIIILLVSPAIMLLFFNATSNKHKHILANGRVIEHAHPFKSDNSPTPFQNHKHSPFELTLLSFLSNAIGLVPFLLAIAFINFQLRKKRSGVYVKSFVTNALVGNYSGRAPPILSY